MPSIKRAGVKAQEVKTGFESYDGPEPHRRGMYRSKITQANFKQFKSGSQGYVLLLELEAEAGDPKDHAQYDGYPIWTNLVLGDKEAMLTRESNFYAALGVKDGPNVVFEEGDLEDGVKIKNIGGKNPVGAIVNADIKMGSYNGEPRPEVDGIYKVRSAGTPSKAAAAIEPDEEEDLLEGEDEVEETEEAEEMSAEEREEELNGLTLAALRKIAKSDYDLDTTGLKKDGLVGAILDYEYGEPEDAEEEPEDEEEPDEEEADEVEEADEEEPDEEEEEADDERAEREQELAELNRIELKKILKGILPDFTVLKRHSDDDIRAAILDEEFGADDETPF